MITAEQRLPGTLPPFVAGPPLSHPVHFFGRERELRRLFHLLRRPPLQNGAIIGPRRSGKTSLLYYLKTVTTTASAHLRPGQRHDWLPGAGSVRWLLLDFQDSRLGQRALLLRALADWLELAVPAAPTLEQFLEAASGRIRQPSVVLLDEIGVALGRYPELDDTFWESLRSLASHQADGNLAFILAAHESPAVLAQRSSLGSPFFNIFGYTATLGPLTEEAARALIASSPLPFPPADVTWIMEQSQRWPFGLQLLCRERLLALEEGITDTAWRPAACEQLALHRETAAPALLPEALTVREQEVLQLIALGCNNQDIAARLVIAVSTVKSHINNIYSKLGVSDRETAIARARGLH